LAPAVAWNPPTVKVFLTFFDFLAILGFFLLTAAVAAVAVLEAAFFCTFGCSCEEKYVLAGRNRSVDTHLMFDWFLWSGLGNDSLSVVLASGSLLLRLSFGEREQQTKDRCEQGGWVLSSNR